MRTASEETLRVVAERADAEFARRTLQSGLALIPFTAIYAAATDIARAFPGLFALHLAVTMCSYALRLVWVRWGWPKYYAARPRFWRYWQYAFVLTGTLSWSLLCALGASRFGFETWTGFMLFAFLVGYAAAAMTHLLAHFGFFVAQITVSTVPMLVAVTFCWGSHAAMINAVMCVYLFFLAYEARILHNGYRAGLLDARMLEEHAAELEAARRQADAANETKSQFLVTVSHQIRTPMNGILGLTRLALDTTLNTEQREYIEGARSSTESLLDLLNGLLDFSRIEANQVEIRETRFDLRELLAGIERHFAPLAREKGLRFRIIGLDPTVPLLAGDPLRLRQILTNLLSNAVKFTHTGSVWLDVRVKTPELPKTVVEFSVGDTGVGIPADRLRHVFEPFAKAAETSLARQSDGLGLGLAISQRLTASLGGELDVESAVGRGSLFRLTLTLPTVAPDAPGDAAAPVRDFSAELAGLRILVAEDNATNQKLICRLLEKAGCQVQPASNGIQALELAATTAFDLILMDIQMPEMDGLTATARIRGRASKAHDTPIVALTANSLAGDQKLCLEAGMDGFLAKPIHPQQLYEAIAQQIRARKARNH